MDISSFGRWRMGMGSQKVAEIQSGGNIQKGHEVHHINRIKTDNRPETCKYYQLKSIVQFMRRTINRIIIKLKRI